MLPFSRFKHIRKLIPSGFTPSYNWLNQLHQYLYTIIQRYFYPIIRIY